MISTIILSEVTNARQPTEVAPSNDLPPEHQEPVGNQSMDLNFQAAVAEMHKDQQTLPPKPKLSIRIPRRGHGNEQTPSSRGSDPIIPSQISNDYVSASFSIYVQMLTLFVAQSYL